jgi:CRISPR system Cascade subunit CasE
MAVSASSLYLSRLVLNQRSQQVISELAHPYEMHRTLMRAFPKASEDTDPKARDEFRVLFRAEANDSRGTVIVYVQSVIEPDWSFLDRLDLYMCTDTEMAKYEYKDIMPTYRRIKNGQVLWFRLRANPTKRVARDGDPLKGKRVELSREEEQIDWLIRKGKPTTKGVPGGFSLLSQEIKSTKGDVRKVSYVKVCCEGKQTWRKKDESDAARKHATTHLAVLFEGLLRVTDMHAFQETLIYGVGTGKAFGFGLLSVAPIER